MKKISASLLIYLSTYSFSAIANNSDSGDMYFSGYTPDITKYSAHLKSDRDYSVLDAFLTQQTIKHSRSKIQFILNALQDNQNKNARIAFIADQLRDIPYIFTGAIGESDWQPASSTYQPGALHIKQDPAYRLDGLDCQTFVQVAMALLYSKNIDEFDQNILKISYGAAGNPAGEIVHFYNRNNFVESDWNPINQRNGWLTDPTLKSNLSAYAAVTHATITRQNWFLFQQKNLSANVRVLNETDGSAMAKRFMTIYSNLDYPNFDSEMVATTYIPKEKIAVRQADGSYQPDQTLLDMIPTPAVVEIVRDTKKWNLGGKNIKDLIGTELSISHMGLLYRKTFQQDDLIYRKVSCNYDNQHQKICAVTPVICQKDHCDELMFLHATDARPNGFHWYKQADGNYACSANVPPGITNFTECNRVEEQPLFDYLTDYQYGSYWYMNSPSIIGIHLEQLI